MTREWQPGDVVTATVMGRPNVRVIAGWSKYDPQLRWGELSPRWADGDDDECWFMPSQVTDHRPLVAIDFEDEPAMDRLADLLENHNWRPVNRTGMFDSAADLAAALREFAAPTPPAEVYMHQVALEDGEIKTALCGKVWKPGGDVAVVGRCPECEQLVTNGWTA